MQQVRLYGNGAAIFHYGKDVIRAVNGVIDLPAMLVPQALAMGFTTQPTGPAEEEPAASFSSTIADAGTLEDLRPSGSPLIDAGVSAGKKEGLAATVADRVALYEKEARDAGYTDDAVAKIVQERIRYDELIADGATEDDAVAAVWGPKTGDASDVETAAVRADLEQKDANVVDPRVKPFNPDAALLGVNDRVSDHLDG